MLIIELDEFESDIEQSIDNQPSIKGEADQIYTLQNMAADHCKKRSIVFHREAGGS